VSSARGSKPRKRRETNETHGAGRIGRKTIELVWAERWVIGDRLRTNEDEIGTGTLGALNDEVGPMTLFVDLGPAPNATVGTPLPLSLEELAFLTKSVFETTAPPALALARGRLREAVTSAGAPTAVARDQHHLAVARARDERSKPDELVTRSSQIGDRKNSGTHDAYRHLNSIGSKGCATSQDAKKTNPRKGQSWNGCMSRAVRA
jgi:hypothetical protein